MTTELRTSDEASLPPSGVPLARKSYVAYVRPLLVAATLVALLSSLPRSGVSDAVRVVLLLSTVAWTAFRVAELKSVVLFLDIDGVWVHAGVLPWSRGVFGIRYRDLDDPVLMQNLASWLLRSHTIVLRHRFASQAPIALDHMSNAPAALERIFRAQRVAEGHPLTGTFNN